MLSQGPIALTTRIPANFRAARIDNDMTILVCYLREDENDLCGGWSGPLHGCVVHRGSDRRFDGRCEDLAITAGWKPGSVSERTVWWRSIQPLGIGNAIRNPGRIRIPRRRRSWPLTQVRTLRLSDHDPEHRPVHRACTVLPRATALLNDLTIERSFHRSAAPLPQ